MKTLPLKRIYTPSEFTYTEPDLDSVEIYCQRATNVFNLSTNFRINLRNVLWQNYKWKSTGKFLTFAPNLYNWYQWSAGEGIDGQPLYITVARDKMNSMKHETRQFLPYALSTLRFVKIIMECT